MIVDALSSADHDRVETQGKLCKRMLPYPYHTLDFLWPLRPERSALVVGTRVFCVACFRLTIYCTVD